MTAHREKYILIIKECNIFTNEFVTLLACILLLLKIFYILKIYIFIYY